jgi:hypothetical protein
MLLPGASTSLDVFNRRDNEWNGHAVIYTLISI